MNKKLLTIGILAAIMFGMIQGATVTAAAPNTSNTVATSTTFLSKEIMSSAPFTSAALAWDEISPPHTSVEAFIRFKYKIGEGNFSEWLTLDEEVASQSGKTTNKFGLASTNLAVGIQYKFEMNGTSALKPTIKNVKVTFLKTVAAGQSLALEQSVFLASVSSDAGLVASSSNSKSFKIIKRSEWGANESYRFLEDNTSDAELIEISDEEYAKYKDELQYSRVVEADDHGNKYKWPLQYPEKVTKFIIHHTATTGNLDNPKQAIRDIYYYHAVTRGWGDIGYNYIIDQDGKMYEGKAGGEGVVGGHAGIGNIGSIGISVLGNYEENKVPKKVKSALVELIAQKAKIHNINPSGRSMFRGVMRDNVFGHKDIMATACPGKYLYEELKSIRSQAHKRWDEIRDVIKGKTEISDGPNIRIKLGFSGATSSDKTSNPQITGDGSFKIYSGTKLMESPKKNEIVKISYDKKYKVEINGKIKYSADKIRVVPDNKTILRIENFNHRPAWNKELNDNEYRGTFEIRKVDGNTTDLIVIDELPLELYLKGLGEAANSDPAEKIKAVVVAARTYAKYYTEKERKFPGKPYDLDDDPNVSQRYLGYGLEKRSKNVVSAVEATRGEIVTYKGTIVKTPYFSQSDGTQTKSAKDVWGWTFAPYLISVDDSYCDGKEFSGHGVGLSGCGAKGMADKGFKYQDILKHYYTGVEITDLY